MGLRACAAPSLGFLVMVFSERCLLQRWRLKVAYDGSGFRGWQPLGVEGARTVHRTLAAALMASHPLHSRLRQAPVLVGCSRTDRGVHAEGQVAHVDLLSLPDLDADTLRRRVNRRLPEDVQLLEAYPVNRSFHARRSALHKRYRYDLLLRPRPSPFEARFVWAVGDLPAATIAEAAQRLNGQALDCSLLTVNWRASCRAGTDDFDEAYYGPLTKRLLIDTCWDAASEKLSVRLECKAFLYRMARVAVSALVAGARGVIDPADLSDASSPTFAKAMRRVKGRMELAPPSGLFLEEVAYPPEAGDGRAKKVVRLIGAAIFVCAPLWLKLTFYHRVKCASSARRVAEVVGMLSRGLAGGRRARLGVWGSSALAHVAECCGAETRHDSIFEDMGVLSAPRQQIFRHGSGYCCLLQWLFAAASYQDWLRLLTDTFSD
ncbi:truA2 [Symbiodinium natans]|uniref:TruA2 protein n=1 Tax=Symbiodinium natans TaxID=878477 RepID=A0A812NCJ8_9DINO|nr:truA2 [Symbiodinium natans]